MVLIGMRVEGAEDEDGCMAAFAIPVGTWDPEQMQTCLAHVKRCDRV